MTSGSASSDRRCLLLIPLAAFIAILPLIVHGCSCGHDFDFHLLNWMEAARQFSHGNLHPHWAFSPAFNAGEPRFVFYPALSWYLGALLGLLLTHLPGVTPAAGWTAAPILFTWITLTASGFTMVRLARTFASPDSALLAAILYLANPYMLFTAYERTAFAELLAAAWIPLLLHAILGEKVTIPRIALPVALLWLTNVPAAIIGSYALALLAVIRLTTQLGAPHLASEMWETRRRVPLRLAFRTLAGTALGLALAAFYIVPVACERRFVQIAMATIADMRIDQNFLFERTGTSSDNLLHDQVLHTASLIAVLLLTATAIALAARRATNSGAPDLASEMWESRRNIPFPTLPLAILTAAIAFLLTPMSAPIWNHAPEAAFLQFPWRLLLIVAPIFALALARIEKPSGQTVLASRQPKTSSHTALASRCPKASSPAVLASGYPKASALGLLACEPKWGFSPWSKLLVAVPLAASLTLPAYRLFRQPCDPADTAASHLALFQSNAGADPTDEYTPTTADNDALKPNNPPYWLADSATAPAPATALRGPAPMHLALTTPRAQTLILNLRDYPAWRITLNGVLDITREPRDDGLIAIPIPAGPSTLDVRYAHTLDQTLGNAITLLALALFLITLRRERRPGS